MEDFFFSFNAIAMVQGPLIEHGMEVIEERQEEIKQEIDGLHESIRLALRFRNLGSGRISRILTRREYDMYYDLRREECQLNMFSMIHDDNGNLVPNPNFRGSQKEKHAAYRQAFLNALFNDQQVPDLDQFYANYD